MLRISRSVHQESAGLAQNVGECPAASGLAVSPNPTLDFSWTVDPSAYKLFANALSITKD